MDVSDLKILKSLYALCETYELYASENSPTEIQLRQKTQEQTKEMPPPNTPGDDPGFLTTIEPRTVRVVPYSLFSP